MENAQYFKVNGSADFRDHPRLKVRGYCVYFSSWEREFEILGTLAVSG